MKSVANPAENEGLQLLRLVLWRGAALSGARLQKEGEVRRVVLVREVQEICRALVPPNLFGMNSVCNPVYTIPDVCDCSGLLHQFRQI